LILNLTKRKIELCPFGGKEMIFEGKKLIAVVLLTFLAVGGSAPARLFSQVAPNAALDGKLDRADKKSDNLVVNVELVNVLFTATDRKGRLVTDLDKSDLRLYEDNKLQAITNFSRETDLPLTIALLIDTSTSIRDRFKFERKRCRQPESS
jgi:hypothetical protein